MEISARQILFCAVLALLASSAQAAIEYKLKILPCPGSKKNSCFPAGMSKSGIAVGYIWYGSLTAVKWVNGKPKVLPTPRGLESEAVSVNDSEQVVGQRWDGSDLLSAATWSSDGVWRRLPTDKKHSRATSINNSGQVAGFASDDPQSGYSAMFWNANAATRLPAVHAGYSAIATVITENGWIGGYEFPNDDDSYWRSRSHAIIWRNGAPIKLGKLSRYPSTIRDINSNGVAVGALMNSSSKLIQPFLWKDGVMKELPTGPEFSGEAKAINDSGVVVGTLGGPNGEFNNFVAVLWQNGALKDLNSLLSEKDRSKYRLVDAVGIDSRGNILGVVYDKAVDRDKTFLLSPK